MQQEVLMPTGPNSQKGLAGMIGGAGHKMQTVTRKIQNAAKARIGVASKGLAGLVALSKSLTLQQRSDFAQKAASARWR
jgi:hypothetical protein